MTVLALLTDAYGGRGGIAKVNRDILAALVAHPEVDRIRVLPRIAPVDADDVPPPGVDVVMSAAAGGRAYLTAVAREVRTGKYDAVVCGHLHLTPVAALAAAWAGVPYVLVVHGLEAWGPPHWPATQGRLATAVTGAATRQATRVVSVSKFTRDRLCARFDVPADRVTVIPNAVDLSAFTPGPRRPDLVARYRLEGRTVLMTLARLPSADRFKGIDETMAALPALAETDPDVAYLVCGDGRDRPRLEALAERLGVVDRVVFAGYVPEAEKADHYRLADAFVMPGRGEGFGLVYLEALACGVPVVASSADASQEAVLGGALGAVVDPDDPASVVSGIRDALAHPKGVPEGLGHFSQARFAERWHAVFDRLISSSRGPSP